MMIVSSTVGRTKPVGVSSSSSTLLMDSNQPMANITSQLEKLSAAVGDIQSRLDFSVPRFSYIPIPSVPKPTIPFNFGFLSQGPDPVVFLPTTGFQFRSSPLFGAGFTSLPQFGEFHHATTLAPTSAFQFQRPLFGLSGTMSTSMSTIRTPTTPFQPWQSTSVTAPQHDRIPLQRPQTVNPLSCWGPPPQRPLFGAFNQDFHSSRVKMEAPRFDGTKVNNWIRGVQFYFDHVGLPDEQRLHYVIMLFDPELADWIWNYAASHESSTWLEFLDDVH